MKNSKTIIFDLGGIILNIDYSLTIKAFQKLGVKNSNEVLFIDDSPQHIEGGQKIRHKYLSFKDGEDVTPLFPDKVQSILH